MKKYRVNEYTEILKETMLKIAKKMKNSSKESQFSTKEASTPASTNKRLHKLSLYNIKSLQF